MPSDFLQLLSLFGLGLPLDNMIIDTHAHLFFPDFEKDIETVISRAVQEGLQAVINVGDDLKTSHMAADFESEKIKIYSSIGSHPHETSKLSTPESIHENMEELEKVYWENPQKVVAVGECGLDFFFEENSDFTHSSLSQDELIALQNKLYLAHINLAKKLDLPLIIHCRDAWDQIFISELQGTTGVFHSFTGSETDAKKALDLGYYLGFSCIVTYPKNEALRQIVKQVPLERILPETDSPFLPPQIKRGQRNEPANVIEVIKIIAQVKNLSLEEVSQTTFKNAQTLFKITSSI